MPKTNKDDVKVLPKKRVGRKGKASGRKGTGFDWVTAKKLFLNSHFEEVKPFFREEFGWDDKKMESGNFKDNVVGWKADKVAYKGKVDSNQLVRALFEQGIILSDINKTRIATMTNFFYVTADVLSKISERHVKGEIGIPFWLANSKAIASTLAMNIQLGKELATSFDQDEGQANKLNPSSRKVQLSPEFVRKVDPEGNIDTTDVTIN